MNTTPAVVAGGAAPDAGVTPPTTQTVPADIRRRVLGMRAQTPEELAAETKIKTDKESADKKMADEKAAADKKIADEAAAGKPKPADATTERVKKVKPVPPLPEPPKAESDDKEAIGKAVREALAEDKKNAAPTVPALKPEEESEVELARVAEKSNPERYAGFAAKVAGFYASHEQLLAAKAAELGGNRSPEFKDYLDSDEYKAFVRDNRPSYARGDREKLKEDLITARAREEARRELEPKLKALERKTAELEHTPDIKARINRAVGIILTDNNEQKDPALEGFKKDPSKFSQEHPEEAGVIAAEASRAVELMEEVYRVDRDLVDVDPTKRPQQAEIRKFMESKNAEMRKANPNGVEMADGRILVDANTYRERKLDRDPRYRTFNADEMVGMIAVESGKSMLDKLSARRVGVNRSVYATTATAPVITPPSQVTPPADDTPSPGSAARAAPGTAVKNGGDKKSLASKYA